MGPPRSKEARMTELHKEQIRHLRCEGVGYKAIAARLGLSENAVKGYCKRNGLAGVAQRQPPTACRHCGEPLFQKARGKKRKFCSDACRRAWWNSHQHLVNRAAFYRLACAHCGREFESYGNQRRKYCGRGCYIAARFGKGENS